MFLKTSYEHQIISVFLKFSLGRDCPMLPGLYVQVNTDNEMLLPSNGWNVIGLVKFKVYTKLSIDNEDYMLLHLLNDFSHYAMYLVFQ